MATANKKLSNYDKSTIPNANEFRFGIVVSEWNEEITNVMFLGAELALLDCGAKILFVGMFREVLNWYMGHKE